jgi:hypothetical protein
VSDINTFILNIPPRGRMETRRRYTDQDANMLISFLQREEHAVISPRAVSMRGVEETAHLSYATVQQCAVVTANVRDFL